MALYSPMQTYIRIVRFTDVVVKLTHTRINSLCSCRLGFVSEASGQGAWDLMVDNPCQHSSAWVWHNGTGRLICLKSSTRWYLTWRQEKVGRGGAYLLSPLDPGHQFGQIGLNQLQVSLGDGTLVTSPPVFLTLFGHGSSECFINLKGIMIINYKCISQQRPGSQLSSLRLTCAQASRFVLSIRLK